MSRRQFLIALPAALLFLPSRALPADYREWHLTFWNQPRRLRFRRLIKGRYEYVDETYWSNGQYHELAYHRLCWLMRDVEANVAQTMDTRLLDLLFAFSWYVGQYGYHNIDFLSGLRTEATSALIEGAVKQGFHGKAKAADMRVPGLSSTMSGQIVRWFNVGGVGFYPDQNFFHTDTGPVRQWTTRKIGVPKNR